MEGEPRGKEEMEIPLKLVIVGDAMCRTETYKSVTSSPFQEGCVVCSTPHPAPSLGTPLYPRALCSLEPVIGPDPAWAVHPFINLCHLSDPSPHEYQGWALTRGRQRTEPSLRSGALSHFGKGVPPCLPPRTGFPEGMGAKYSREGGTGRDLPSS